MKYILIGLHPDNAIGHVLKLYDERSDDEKIKFLINNHPLDKLPSTGDIPKDFQGKTIDLNAGELLGIGLVAAHFNWMGEKSGETYQAAVGLGDSEKHLVENHLSDGGVYQDSKKQKMLYQQVLVQGYYPEKVVTTEDVITGINDKIAKRERYPENCGLIVNIFSKKNTIDYFKAQKGCELDKYDAVFAIWYQLPELKYAYVMNLDSRIQSIELFALNTMPIELQRFPRADTWQFNF